MRPFLIALQFLTCLPVRLTALPSAGDMGRSLLYYPLVGLLIGALLWLGGLLLAGVPAALQAALLLALWVGLTGGLHLDGLADSADAWLGGFGDRQRTLEIMKDPRSGPIAVVVVVLLLLLKYAALQALLESQASLALLWVPMIGRGAVLGLFLSTPYVRAGGLGQVLAAQMPRRAVAWVLLGSAVAVLLADPGAGLAALLVAAGVFLYLRAKLLARLGGTTGDTAGALLELVECGALLGWALYGA